MDFLFRDGLPVSGPGTAFVIAKLSLDYLQEMNFPGVAKVGSKILSMGKSSFVIGQAIFLNGQCCSTAQSVIVQIDENTKRPLALTESLKEVLTVVKS